jgi:hypothetical protein
MQQVKHSLNRDSTNWNDLHDDKNQINQKNQSSDHAQIWERRLSR